MADSKAKLGGIVATLKALVVPALCQPSCSAICMQFACFRAVYSRCYLGPCYAFRVCALSTHLCNVADARTHQPCTRTWYIHGARTHTHTHARARARPRHHPDGRQLRRAVHPVRVQVPAVCAALWAALHCVCHALHGMCAGTVRHILRHLCQSFCGTVATRAQDVTHCGYPLLAYGLFIHCYLCCGYACGLPITLPKHCLYTATCAVLCSEVYTLGCVTEYMRDIDLALRCVTECAN